MKSFKNWIKDKKSNKNNKCECSCFPCSKLKNCEKCTCKNCDCKGCECSHMTSAAVLKPSPVKNAVAKRRK